MTRKQLIDKLEALDEDDIKEGMISDVVSLVKGYCDDWESRAGSIADLLESLDLSNISNIPEAYDDAKSLYDDLY